MPVNGMNTGRDYTFGVFDANTNTLVNLGDIQSFDVKAHKHQIASHPYNNVPRFGYVPAGFSGTFRIVRTVSILENLQIQLAALFNQGGIVAPGFINCIVNNADGSINRYQYVGAVFWMNTVASGSREKTVDQDLEWMASDMLVVA